MLFSHLQDCMSINKRILFLDSNHPLLHEQLQAAGFFCDLQYEWSKEKVMQELHNYIGVVIRSRFKLDKEILDKGTNLKFIARAGAGMENIDVAYAESKGIKCLHAPEGNRDAVGEHALGMLLMLLNKLKKADSEVRQGIWLREENRGHEIQGKTVGIIGYGNMGSAFAQRLKGFDCKVIAYDKYKKNYSDGYVKEATMEELYEKADIISFHLPLTDETYHLANSEFFKKIRKNIYFINTARGKNVDTADLVEQIKTGKVLGACLDVLEYESLSFEAIDASKLPEPFQYLIKSDKVILTPHIAGWTFESHEKIAETLVRKIKGLRL